MKKSTQGKEFRIRRSKRNDGERQENGKASILKEGWLIQCNATFMCLQLILWCFLAIFLFLLSWYLGQFRKNFVPKWNFFSLVSVIHPRFHIEDKIFLLLFCKLWPRDWRRTRFEEIWRPEGNFRNITRFKMLLINKRAFITKFLVRAYQRYCLVTSEVLR